jgi:hypothetical protein
VPSLRRDADQRPCWSWKKADPLLVPFPQAVTTLVGPSGGRHHATRSCGTRWSRRPGPTWRRYRLSRNPLPRRQGDVGRRARRSERGCRLPQSTPAAVGSCPLDEHGQTPYPAEAACSAQRRSGAGGSLPGLEPTDTELRLSGRRQPAPPVACSAAPALVLELALSTLRAIKDDLRLLLDVCAIAAPGAHHRGAAMAGRTRHI